MGGAHLRQRGGYGCEVWLSRPCRGGDEEEDERQDNRAEGHDGIPVRVRPISCALFHPAVRGKRRYIFMRSACPAQSVGAVRRPLPVFTKPASPEAGCAVPP